jgi:hypothetical protein
MLCINGVFRRRETTIYTESSDLFMGFSGAGRGHIVIGNKAVRFNSMQKVSLNLRGIGVKLMRKRTFEGCGSKCNNSN